MTIPAFGTLPWESAERLRFGAASTRLGGTCFADEIPVSNLSFDLALLSAALSAVFPRVAFDSVSIYVERGDAPIARDYDLGSLVHNRGQPLPRFAAGTAGRRTAYESPEFTFRVARR